MKTAAMVLCAASLLAMTAADAVAMPVPAVPTQPAAAALEQVVYGYGPKPYGLYYGRRTRARRSYGTGYHGRGTKSGGPVGGLPSRN